MSHRLFSLASEDHMPRPMDCGASPRRVGLALLGALLVFSPLIDGGTTHVAVMIIRLMILCLLGVHLLHGISIRGIAVPRIASGYAIGSYLGLGLISAVFSDYTNQSFQWIVVLVSYAVFLYLLVSFLTAWECVATLAAILVGMGLFEAGCVFVQAWWYLRPRPSGTFFNPNFVAGYLAAVGVLLIGLSCSIISGRTKWIAARGYRILGVTVGAILVGSICIAVVLTKSRGGGLALLGGLALVLGLQFGRKGIGLFLLILLAALAIPNPWRDRFYVEYLTNPVGYARWQIWQSAVVEMMEHPFGIGLGMYQYHAPRYMFPIEGEITRYGRLAHAAHNEYIQMGVELGWASLLVFCWGVVAVARDIRKGLSLRLRQSQRGLLIGTSAAAGTILLQAAVDSSFHEPAIAILLAACVGICLSIRRLSRQEAASETHVVSIYSPAIAYVLSFILIGGCTIEIVKLGWAWIAYDEGSRAVRTEDLPKGIDLYKKAVAMDPGKAMYHNSMAAAHFQLFQKNRNADAINAVLTELQTAASLNPLDSRIHERLGFVYAWLANSLPASDYLSVGQRKQKAAWLQSARSTYLRALELEPFSAFHRLELGRLSLALGDREGAKAWVQESLAIEPNFLPGRAWLAHFYVDTEQMDSAIQEYREIVERRRRYSDWPKNPMEERFLSVDLRGLESALERAGART